MITIQESGMSFGPFTKDHVFCIENSSTLLTLNKSSGIAIAEFLLFKSKNNKNYISIIEAKTSSPKPTNKEAFDTYISEINTKLSNSLHLFISYYSKRHLSGFDELPEQFKQLTIEEIHFELILVIKTSKDDWLRPISDELKSSLKLLTKLWNLSPNAIKVFNEDTARTHQLVS